MLKCKAFCQIFPALELSAGRKHANEDTLRRENRLGKRAFPSHDRTCQSCSLIRARRPKGSQPTPAADQSGTTEPPFPVFFLYINSNAGVGLIWVGVSYTQCDVRHTRNVSKNNHTKLKLDKKKLIIRLNLWHLKKEQKKHAPSTSNFKA